MDPKSIFRVGPTLTTFFLLFFLVDEGTEDQIPLLAAPAKQDLNGVSLAGR